MMYETWNMIIGAFGEHPVSLETLKQGKSFLVTKEDDSLLISRNEDVERSVNLTAPRYLRFEEFEKWVQTGFDNVAIWNSSYLNSILDYLNIDKKDINFFEDK